MKSHIETTTLILAAEANDPAGRACPFGVCFFRGRSMPLRRMNSTRNGCRAGCELPADLERNELDRMLKAYSAESGWLLTGVTGTLVFGRWRS